MSDILLPAGARAVIARLEAAGYAAFVVGGCVRDKLLGRPESDWDVTTSARPEQIKAVFADLRTVDTGIRHGTVTVLWEGEPYEVTTFRVDGAYTDGRHPDRVTFSPSLSEDLARRDFTVNAMAYAPGTGLVDPWGGREDLARSLLRAVGDPTLRFSEDALRILRAVRFASVLGFAVEEKTLTAALALRERLSLVSGERLAQEMNKLLTGPHVAGPCGSAPEILSAAWPFLSPGDFRRAGPLLAEAAPLLPVRLAVLLAGRDPATLPALLLGCRESAATAREAASILSAAQSLAADSCDRVSLLTLLGRYPLPVCLAGAQVAALCFGLSPEAGRRASRDLSALSAGGAVCRIDQLAVSGADLVALGIPRGPAVGRCLDALLTEVMAGRLANTPEALTAFAADLARTE